MVSLFHFCHPYSNVVFLLTTQLQHSTICTCMQCSVINREQYKKYLCNQLSEHRKIGWTHTHYQLLNSAVTACSAFVFSYACSACYKHINLSITKNNSDGQSLWDSLLLILKLLYFTANHQLRRKQLESREKVSQYVAKIICGKNMRK